jgi:hypothetical protein
MAPRDYRRRRPKTLDAFDSAFSAVASSWTPRRISRGFTAAKPNCNPSRAIRPWRYRLSGNTSTPRSAAALVADSPSIPLHNHPTVCGRLRFQRFPASPLNFSRASTSRTDNRSPYISRIRRRSRPKCPSAHAHSNLDRLTWLREGSKRDSSTAWRNSFWTLEVRV